MMLYDLYVRPVLNGFVCGVGCQTLVFTSIEQLAENMVAYYRDPETVEKRFRDNAVNRTLHVLPEAVPTGRGLEPVASDREVRNAGEPLRPTDAFANAQQELP